jgi:glycosyltransferase involved in cell wall biosynthesis
MEKPRLLFLVKQKQGDSLWTDPTLKKPGLSNSIESLVHVLVENGIDASVEIVVDRNGINRVICQTKPTVVIVEAYWVTPGKMQLLKYLHPDIHWIVRNHSEVPFLAQEGNAGAWNCEYLKMGVEVSSVSDRTVDDLKPIIDNLGIESRLLTHLPNVYHNYTTNTPKAKPLPDDEIHIGCFGAIRTLKNQFEQSMAAIGYANKVGKKLFFHINSSRVEGNSSQPLRNMQGVFERLSGCELIQHPWMMKDEFYELMRSRIDLVLQCSLTESFNIVAADAVYCGVPVVTSPEIRWLSARYHCNPNCTSSIIAGITHVFNKSASQLNNLIEHQLSNLTDYNTRALSVWLRRFS